MNTFHRGYPAHRRTAQSALCLLLILCLLLGGAETFGTARAEETGTVNAKVVLRKAADKTSEALQTIPEGDKVVLLNLSGGWYKVSYGSFKGYIMKQYITVSANSVVKNADKIADIGDPPGAMRIGDSNSDVKKLQQAMKILGYYTGKIDGDYGDGTTAAVMEYQADQKLLADGVAGRETVKSIFGSCAKTSMTKQPETTTASASATASPVAASASSSGSSSAKGSTVDSIEAISSAPSATKQGDTGTNVVKLQQALEYLGYYSGTIDGSYGEGTVNAVKRLQRNRGMKEDGVAGAATIRVLFGSSAKTVTASSSKTGSSASSGTSSKSYTTEVLDWFADNVTSVIPKNAKFVVKDVRTGKTFNAVRWSGVNHLDAEPRTSEDTATMKSIYGGAWSWNRRAILILYNGHVYAASMNGMPHGTTTIDNGFAGHFCIHFKNSKTHGTQKVDADHQAAVTSASKATW